MTHIHMSTLTKNGYLHNIRAIDCAADGRVMMKRFKYCLFKLIRPLKLIRYRMGDL